VKSFRKPQLDSLTEENRLYYCELTWAGTPARVRTRETVFSCRRPNRGGQSPNATMLYWEQTLAQTVPSATVPPF
jgi:hypothetical protein